MNIKQDKFTWATTTSLSYIASIIVLFAGILFIPLDFFDENGLVEMFEIYILSMCALFSFLEYRKQDKYKHVFLTISLIFTLFIGRELSWGRVFFLKADGEVISRRDWVFGGYIYYVVGIYILSVLIHAIKTKFIQKGFALFKNSPIIIFDFILIILMIGVSMIGEKYYVNLLPEHLHFLNLAIEESAEVAMYFAASLVIYYYAKQARNLS